MESNFSISMSSINQVKWSLHFSYFLTNCGYLFIEDFILWCFTQCVIFAKFCVFVRFGCFLWLQYVYVRRLQAVIQIFMLVCLPFRVVLLQCVVVDVIICYGFVCKRWMFECVCVCVCFRCPALVTDHPVGVGGSSSCMNTLHTYRPALCRLWLLL